MTASEVRMANRTYTTREVAEAIGISEHTLYRWLSDHALREPRRTVTLGKREIRLWTDRDIERVRTFVGQRRRNYGERPRRKAGG